MHRHTKCIRFTSSSPLLQLIPIIRPQVAQFSLLVLSQRRVNDAAVAAPILQHANAQVDQR